MAIIIGDQNPDKNDALVGTADDDEIFGLTGDDSLRGQGGDDTLWGGEGSDTLVGGDGADTLLGESGDDVLQLTQDDILNGGDGVDTARIETPSGASGATFSDLSFDASQSIERLAIFGDVRGTRDSNVFDLSNVDVSYFDRSAIRLLEGDDTFRGSAGADRVDGGNGDDLLEGGVGDDTLEGGIGINTLDGGDGDDLLYEMGAGRYFGGDGDDTLVIRSGTKFAELIIDASLSIEKIDAQIFGTGEGNLFDFRGLSDDRSFANVQASAGDDTLIGSLGTDWFSGEGGDDRALGGADLDRLDGGVGNDVLKGDAGDDHLLGQNGDDRLAGGDGDDRAYGGYGADVIWGDAGDDQLFGEVGRDTLGGGDGADTLTGGDGDRLIGAAGDDVVILEGGVVVASEILGGDGRDRVVIDGVGSVSTLILDAEASVESLDLGGAILLGTSGADVVDVSGVRSYRNGSSFSLGAGNDRFTGGARNETVDGGGGDDRLVAGRGVNTLLGDSGDDSLTGSGVDSLIGGGGNDVYTTDSSDVVIFEEAGGGVDVVRASTDFNLDDRIENLTLIGGAAIDGYGNARANVVVGNGGANVLSGADGADRLTGGGGGDAFLFDARLRADNVDRVADFGRGADTLLLDITIFAEIDAGRLDADAFVVGRAARDAQDRIIYNDRTGEVLYDRDGAGGADAIAFATLDGGLELTHRDVIVG